ncbi:hypothetical protein PND36_11880, partial [Lacticaseibacillus rhamnosus]|nr:hypothetical protein [Lacticaseibacillus rhamnosus]
TIFAHAITTDAWRNSLDHYQEFVIIVALDLKIEEKRKINIIRTMGLKYASIAEVPVGSVLKEVAK